MITLTSANKDALRREGLRASVSAPGALLCAACLAAALFARVCASDPTALHLRAMNMLYEAIKERGAMVVVPSSVVETMGPGGTLGLVAAAKQA